MAETYKGLTIRIGADVSGLSKALRAANTAARTTESQLRKMKQALKFEPGNADAISEQVGGIARRAMESASRLAHLKTSAQQVGSALSKLDSRTIKELSDSTKDAALDAERAKDQYNAINAALEKYNLQAMKSTGFDLREVNDEEFEAVVQEMIELGEWTERDAQRIENLKNNWHEASDALTTAKAVAQFKDLEVEIVKTDAEMGSFVSQLHEVSGSSVSKTISDIEDELTKLDAAAEAANEEFDRLDEELRLDPGNIELAQQHTKALEEATDLANRKADLLQRALDAYDSAGIERADSTAEELAEDVDRAQKSFYDLNKQVEEAAGELGNLQAKAREMELLDQEDTQEFQDLQREIADTSRRLDELKADASDAERALDTAEARVEQDKLQNELEETERKLDENRQRAKDAGDAFKTAWGDEALSAVENFGQALETYVTQRLKRVGEYSLQAGRDVDSSFRDMRKTVDATESEYEDLRSAAMDFASTHVTSSDQMLEFEALAGQIGIATEDLQTYAEVIAQLQTATDIEGPEAALKVGQMVNVLNDLDGSNVNQFADALVRLGNNMPAQESAIMQIAQRLSSVASIAGMSTPEILAWSSAIASTGQRSESAATAISNTMQMISLAVSDGGDNLEDFAARAGMSAEEFADTWRSNPTEALRAWINGISEADAAGEDLYTLLGEIGISGVRQTQAIAGLTATIDTLDDAMLMSQDAWDGVSDQWGDAGDAAREADRKAEGLSGSLAKLENAAQVAGAELAEGMVPFVEMASGAMSELAQFMHDLPKPAKTAIVAVGGIAAALGPLIVGGVVIVKSFDMVSKAVKGFSAAASVAQGAGGLLGTAITALANPVGIAAVALGGLALIVGGTFVAKAIEGRKQAERLSQATDAMRDSANDASALMESGARPLSDFGLAAHDAALNVEELNDQLEQHNERMSKIAEPTEETIGMLGQYQDVIDRFFGAGHVYGADDWAALQWAVAGLNEELGTTITTEDILNGRFEDQTGTVYSTRDALDALIQKRQEEARVAATQELYTEALKNQLSLERNLDSATDAYNERLDARIQALMENNGYTEDYARALATAESTQWEEYEALQAATDAYDAATEEVDAWSDQMAEAAEVALESAEDVKTLIEGMDGLASVLKDQGTDIDAFSEALFNAGVSTDELKSIGSENLAALAKACNGDIQSMISAIQLYNGTHLDEQTGEIVVDFQELTDANGEIVVWNGTELVYKDSGIAVESGELRDAQNRIYTWNGTTLQAKKTFVSVNTSDAENKLNWLRRVWDGRTFTIKIRAAADSFASKVAGFGNAAGGHIPAHADGGFIATHPVLTDYGWIGEAGAEAYTGNSIVPLTNTRYSQPFVDLLAKGMQKQLGGVGETYINNYYIDGNLVASDARLAAALDVVAERVGGRRRMGSVRA